MQRSNRLASASLALAMLVGLSVSAARANENGELFRERIALLFERRCLSCHNDGERKGGLSLQTAASLEAGGDSGTPVLAGDPGNSYLLELVTPQAGHAEMPKGADALSSDDLAAVRAWIEGGAQWPDGIVLKERRVADADWWSLRPLVRPPLPQLSAPASSWAISAIDGFIAARHAEAEVRPAPEAGRATLIRRLYFDLLGLPPTPEEVDEFVVDQHVDAYERLVDRLLQSPRYGERWARHWLDVVHYGETHGYDKDQPRPNAWPYRDYVIRALNSDKPYSRFVQEQLAGDVLFPGTADGIEALGFIAAGPWDLIGHAEVPETKIDGQIARHLDRDDMVCNTINTFCSLTIQCAQCHNHKFDPITQEEYYSLQAVFAAIDRADKEYDVDPAIGSRRTELRVEEKRWAEEKRRLEQLVLDRAGPELIEIDRQLAEASKPAGGIPPQHGYHSAIEPKPELEKWVQIDLGQSFPIERIVYVACHDDFNRIGAGFGFPVRYRIEISDDADFRTGVIRVRDETAGDAKNPGTTPQSDVVGGKPARYVRFTATRLALRQNDYIFAMSELSVLNAAGENLAMGKTVTALDSIEAPIRWGKQNLVDGIHPATQATTDEIASLRRRRESLLQQKVPETLLRELDQSSRSLRDAQAALQAMPPPHRVYAGTVHSGTGAFTGTGARGGQPRPIHVLPRGDVKKPGTQVGPGALQALASLSGNFSLPESHSEAERRAALARWLTSTDNPLTWRSIVNRVWLYHFGQGIVDTPNDFGRMGQQPTHPQLLDWLAVEFRDGGQSQQRLHRQIVLSATYRQASEARSSFARADANNVTYWHMNRRRLEAEAIRDSVLWAAGQLDLTMGGPSFRDFVVEKPEHSPHYQYHLHDPEDPRSHRRSIYRFLVRSQQQPFMTTLDCADPSMAVDKRNQTISPLQALALMNNQLVISMSRHFAERVRREEPDLELQAVRAFRLATSRTPQASERDALVTYATQHGLENLCRVLLNLNEFVFVD